MHFSEKNRIRGTGLKVIYENRLQVYHSNDIMKVIFIVSIKSIIRS